MLYAGGGWSASAGPPLLPSPPASECNRDGSTRFFTLNTDPSRIKQELFLFISCGPISPPSISHFHQFSEAVFGFWYFPIISKNFQGNQYSRSKRRWWHLNKKVYTLFDILKWGQFAMDFLLENISFQLKVDILEYFLRLVQHWESWNLENPRVLPVLTMFEEQGLTKGSRQKTDILQSGWP